MDERLLIPGWAGELGLDEALWLREQIESSESLRRSWHIRKSRGRHLRLTTVAAKAYPEDPRYARDVIRRLVGSKGGKVVGKTALISTMPP